MVKIVLYVPILFLSLSCGGNQYINKKYGKPAHAIKLAIVPVFNQFEMVSDNAFEKAFAKAYVQEMVAPSSIRAKVFEDEVNAQVPADQKLKRIFQKVTQKEFSQYEMKEFMSLKAILSMTEIDYLKTRLDNANMILFPMVLNATSYGRSGVGYGRVRVFDLESGDFVYERSVEAKALIQPTEGSDYEADEGFGVRDVINEIAVELQKDFDKVL